MSYRAMFVGIDVYPYPRTLKGCKNDVADIYQTLLSLGIVHKEECFSYVDGDASRKNILCGLNYLLENATPGDALIFYFAGEGEKILDRNQEESDYYDEAILPIDYATSGIIIDDELSKIINNLSRDNSLEVILDCCYSGTGTRLSNQKRDVEIVPGLNHVLWAASRAYQKSDEYKIGGKQRGIFTYCFCKVLRSRGLNLRRRDLQAQIESEMARLGCHQIPRLEATDQAIAGRVFSSFNI